MGILLLVKNTNYLSQKIPNKRNDFHIVIVNNNDIL